VFLVLRNSLKKIIKFSDYYKGVFSVEKFIKKNIINFFEKFIKKNNKIFR